MSAARDLLKTLDLPTTRDENWKYANLRALERVAFDAVTTLASVAAETLPAPIESFERYVFVDGLLSPGYARTSAARYLTVAPMPGASRSELSRDLRFAALNETMGQQAARIAVPERTSAAIELLFVASADGQAAASYPRLEVTVAAHGQLTLLERHVSVGNDANFVNSAVTLDLEQQAKVTHYRMQQLGTRALWMDTLSATLAPQSTYTIFPIQIGAASSRSTLQIRLADAAELDLRAIALAYRHQVQDAYALVEHVGPASRSRQCFRGIAAGRGRAAFNSKVMVHATAQGADSHQSLKGLLAGPDAEIDVRPQLQIHTDDVRCAHGATAGKLDDQQLFYLLSRGLSLDTAQQLLKRAFLEDVAAKIPIPELRRQIESHLGELM